ncbi:10834_t:CDS:2 [Diversispora eburnea]|uniref:10834_t:CDS:1 n=1 Tax=Diversispora eburnea TaxID=1213867 RepID=A0A9N9FNS0_9GLOM|nr:10834_t:CDS:2 [Diversispora eburnea]
MSANMHIYENRLNSFTNKKKKWPHLNKEYKATPQSLARAGFYFYPATRSPDNVICYLCHKSMEGWDSTDDPNLEHIYHSSECPWAIFCCILKKVSEDEVFDDWDEIDTLPTSKKMEELRVKTYGDWWPHDGKKGWLGTVKKMSRAGFIYAPSIESLDNAMCVYCEVCLSDWEQRDDPMKEHKKRFPSCPFVVQFTPKVKKQRRSEKMISKFTKRFRNQKINDEKSHEKDHEKRIEKDHEKKIEKDHEKKIEKEIEMVNGKVGKVGKDDEKVEEKEKDDIEILDKMVDHLTLDEPCDNFISYDFTDFGKEEDKINQLQQFQLELEEELKEAKKDKEEEKGKEKEKEVEVKQMEQPEVEMQLEMQFEMQLEKEPKENEVEMQLENEPEVEDKLEMQLGKESEEKEVENNLEMQLDRDSVNEVEVVKEMEKVEVMKEVEKVEVMKEVEKKEVVKEVENKEVMKEVEKVEVVKEVEKVVVVKEIEKEKLVIEEFNYELLGLGDYEYEFVHEPLIE